MWNMIAGKPVGPQTNAPSDEQDENDTAGNVPDRGTDDTGGEAGQGAPEGQGQNVIGETLSARARTLSPQESQTFADGITVPALQVLKKIIPEIGPAIDQLIQKKGMGQGPSAAPGAPPASAQPMPPAAPQQPRSYLSRV